jgi:hypothetical protein
MIGPMRAQVACTCWRDSGIYVPWRNKAGRISPTLGATLALLPHLDSSLTFPAGGSTRFGCARQNSTLIHM